MQFKQIIFFVILHLLHCAVTARAQSSFNFTEVQLDGWCPKISYINNIDLPRIVGFWYRAFSTSNFPSLCYENQGQNVNIASYEEMSVSLTVCCRSAADNTTTYCGRKIGSGTCTATNNPGEFVYEFADQSVKVYLLDVVYDRFAVVYGYTADNEGFSDDDIIFILSRDYNISGTETERVRKVLERNGIDFSKAKPVAQGPNIPYLPNHRC